MDDNISLAGLGEGLEFGLKEWMITLAWLAWKEECSLENKNG